MQDSAKPSARGYFAVGIEHVSKPMNVGNLFRSAHAFGASFVFTVAANYARGAGGKADTSKSLGRLPFYSFPDASTLVLPDGCDLVGVEITEDAVDLPSFRHPRRAAYIFGAERGGLTEAMLARCAHVVRIPTKFSINVGMAGAILMYDRTISLTPFARRPVAPGGPAEPMPAHVFGDPRFRHRAAPFRDTPPGDS